MPSIDLQVSQSSAPVDRSKAAVSSHQRTSDSIDNASQSACSLIESPRKNKKINDEDEITPPRKDERVINAHSSAIDCPPSHTHHTHHSNNNNDLDRVRSLLMRRLRVEWPMMIMLYCLVMVTELLITPRRVCVPGWDQSNRTLYSDEDDDSSTGSSSSQCGTNIDPAYDKPLKKNPRVSTPLLFLINGLIPGVIALCSLAIWTYHHGIQAWMEPGSRLYFASNLERMARGGFLNQALVLLATNLLKLMVGGPRPNFYRAMVSDYSLYKRQMRKSFPSGHASSSVASGILTLLWMLDAMESSQKIMRTSQSNNDGIKKTNDSSSSMIHSLRHLDCYFCAPLWSEIGRDYQILSAVLCCIPMVPGLLISATRVMDFWHFPVDVSAGALLGSLVALYTYRLLRSELRLPV